MSVEVKEQAMDRNPSQSAPWPHGAEHGDEHKGGRSSYARIPAAFRMQFVVPQLIWVPLMVFVSAWALAAGIGWWVHLAVDSRDPVADPIYTGASQAPLWTMLFMAAYSASNTFPFSLALSYSRRVYLIGTLLAFGAVSLGFGAAFVLAAQVEEWTGGWGAHVYTFALPFLISDGAWAAGLLIATTSMLLMQFGFGGAMLYKRFSVMTIWMIVIGLALVLAVAVMLVVVNDGWPSVWAWLVDQTALSLAGWAVIPTVLLAAINYGLIRRATP